MVEMGRLNRLKIVELVEFGVYLDGGELGKILLPYKYVPGDSTVGDFLVVFLYFDSEDRPIATTLKPSAMVGQFAVLTVVATTSIGAFLDWGLPKDLFVPLREQQTLMKEGESYTVYLYCDDESGRIAATSKIDKYLGVNPVEYKEGMEVSLLISSQTDLGYKAIINDSDWGVLYKSEVYRSLTRGSRVAGYIKKLRADGKIDLSLHKVGLGKLDDFSAVVLQKLRDSKGFLSVTDKSQPELIHAMFGVSKKTFKKSVGILYKKRIITIEENGIRLVESS